MSTTVDVGSELQVTIARILREAAPSVLPRMEQEARQIMDEAVARWPVQDRSGRYRKRAGEPHSRDLFRVETQVQTDAVEVRIVNSAKYLYYIKSMQNELDGKAAWVRLIRTPARAKAKQLAEELRDDLVKLAGKG